MRGPRSFDGRWPGRTVLGRPLPLLLVFTAIGLAARVFRLGARVAHQDEARVAHWILHYMAVGRWEYRAIIHGPFLPHVNGVVFDLLGPSDFSMRLIVAVIGGLLPLSAWLLRDRLRSTEVVFLGAILALNPVLLYYSRFMRNDLLLAAMAFTAFALAVRAIDTGQARYLLAAGLVFGLGATTKENALLYPLAWGGALVLLLDHRLFIARYTDESWRAVGKRWLGRGVRSLWSWRHPIVGSVVLMAVVVVAFYAPKPDLYRTLGNPARLPGVLDAATLGTWEKFTDLWASAGMQKHSYPRFLGHLLLVLGVGGLTPVVFGTIGFVAERYRTAGPRDLVAACFYWALASVVGYPAVVDIMAGWTAVHVLVPLAVPAAVGLALVLRKGRAAIARDDGRTTAVVVVLSVLALTATIGGAVAINFAYPAHPKNPVVQYAQPAGDMKPTLHEIERISAANEGVDVTFYGGDFYAPEDLSKDLTLRIEDGGYRGWFDRLPMAWYFELYGTNVSSTTDPTWIRTHRPPVVITLEETADDLEGDMEGYRRVTHQGYLHSRPLVFYLRRDAPRASR